ncbi:MAG: thioredoxin domain-containing protein [Planctomycetia bacterium]|nr:thioredoxin domain-containing protein [Planctomycetia bacterium]
MIYFAYHYRTKVLVFLLTVLLITAASQTRADDGSRISLLEFTAASCPACQEVEPLVQEMLRKGYPVQKVSMDDQASHPMFQQYRVTAMPCFVLLVDGQEVERTVGVAEGRAALGADLLAMFNRAITMTQQSAAPASSANSEISMSSDIVPNESGAIMPVSAVVASTSLPPASPADIAASQAESHSQPPTTAEAMLKSVSVRIRVYNNNTVDRGTGTIIHVNRLNGTREALVLTCGHLFRPNQGRGQIEVDLFEPTSGQSVTVIGQCLAFDDEIDVGFVGIPIPFDITPIPLARPDSLVAVGDSAVSIGCNGGADPTLLEHKILSTREKFFRPNDLASGKKEFCYLEVSNAPVGGRSGGGLFSLGPQGYELTGVCNAGDTTTNEGYFVPTAIVYEQLLAKESLRFVYNDLIGSPAGMTPVVAAGSEVVTPLAPALGALPVTPMPAPTDPAYGGIPASIAQQGEANHLLQPLTDDALSATLQELRKRQQAGAEIICVVHWSQGEKNPDGTPRATEVIRLPAVTQPDTEN